jgi:hypothetical protein
MVTLAIVLVAMAGSTTRPIHFHNSALGTSTRISGSARAYTTSTGPWYTITASKTVYVALESRLAVDTYSSLISTYLEVKASGQSFYIQYPVYFEIK